MDVFPICLINLHEKMCVVVGGGVVAERKVNTLLERRARVVVISPTLTADLRRKVAAGEITHVERAYRHGDLEGVFLCIVAAGNRQVAAAVWQEGNECGVLVNAVDEAAHSHFIMPATVRQGDLTMAISTGGQSPALATRIKEQLAALFGPEYGALLQILGALRPRAIQELPSKQRADFFYAVVDDAAIMRLLRRGSYEQALAHAEQVLDHYRGQKVST